MSKHLAGSPARKPFLTRAAFRSRERLRYLAAPAAFVLAGALLVLSPAAPAQAACANPIVCENQLPGTPQSTWDVSSPSTTIQGFADPFSVNVGQSINFKIKLAGDQLRDRHLPDGLLRRGRRPQDHQPHAEHLGVAEPARLQHQHRDGPGRLRQLGRVRDLERSVHCRVRACTSRTSTGPTAPPTRTRSRSW